MIDKGNRPNLLFLLKSNFITYFNFYRISESCKIIEFTKIIDLFNIRIHDKNIKYFNKYESIGAEFNFISNTIYTKS